MPSLGARGRTSCAASLHDQRIRLLVFRHAGKSPKTMPPRRAAPGSPSGREKRMTVILRTDGGCEFDPEHLLDVFGEQRRRFVTILRGFGPGDWAAPTRCSVWSAQDVVRHLSDNNRN